MDEKKSKNNGERKSNKYPKKTNKNHNQQQQYSKKDTKCCDIDKFQGNKEENISKIID